MTCSPVSVLTVNYFYMQMIVQYYSHIKTPELISQTMSEVMESCSSWLVDNKLSLHLGKTECVLFGPRKKMKTIINFNVKCKDQTIKSQDLTYY